MRKQKVRVKEFSWVLDVNPKVGKQEQGNKVKPLQLHKGFGDGRVEVSPVNDRDIVRVWNKEGLLISTYVIGDYEKVA